MTFKDYFNSKLPTDKSKINEVTLFTVLCDALNSSSKSIYAKRAHQEYCHFYSSGQYNTCELCDVLVIFKMRDYYRLSFVQNKFSRKSFYKGLNKFSINCRQHYLLCAKPQIIINGIKSNILRNSQYDTITTYSVFYKDSKGCFDFDLASANSVICSRFKSICSAITRSSYVASHRHSSKTEDYATASKMRDVISYKNCDEIEEDLCFGEVLKSDDENKKDELFYVIARFIEKDEFIDSFFGDINWNKYKENKTVLNDHEINWSIPNLLLIDCTKINVLWDEEYSLNKKIIINYKF